MHPLHLQMCRSLNPKMYILYSYLYLFIDGIFINLDELLLLLIKLGYERTALVRDKSEFAIRGSIIDIFLPQFEKPIRIDLFDDEIETIFEFDPITQKRLNKSSIKSFKLNPSSELIIDNKNLEKFRSKFRSEFQNFRKSQTYEMFSSGIIPSGSCVS